jgi:polysaccharide export outer membrane protein
MSAMPKTRCKLRSKVSLAAVVSALLAGCGTLPNTGPSAATMQQSKAVRVVDATPALAQCLLAQSRLRQAARIQKALHALAGASAASPFTFGPGDRIRIALWSISPLPESSSTMTPSTEPRVVHLGTYVVSANGTIVLPYIGPWRITGLRPGEAQEKLSARYGKTGLFQDPSVHLHALSVPRKGILVTGSLGQPKIVPWSPAGVTLANAITQALGSSHITAEQGGPRGPSRYALRVLVIRGANHPIQIPMAIALEKRIPLLPGDRVVVESTPAVRVTVLGGGIPKNGVYAFADTPTLADVLADASGLNSATADDHAVFVLRGSRDGKLPKVYDFEWNRTQGLIASQRFPIHNGDMVYVANAPIVPIEKVVAIFFQLALPAQVLNSSSLL